MSVTPSEKPVTSPGKAQPGEPAVVAGPAIEAFEQFAEQNNLVENWKALNKGTKKQLQGLALEKFNLLSTFRDTWSNELYKPKVGTVRIEGHDTAWLTVDCDHGKQAYVFSADGTQAFASGFMPETGESLGWTPGFVIDEYLEYEVVKSNATKD